MANTTLPRTDAGWFEFGAHYSDVLNAQTPEYGLSVPEATTIKSLYLAYRNAYLVAKAPATRTPLAVRAKDDALAAFRAAVGKLNRRVRGYEQITDALLIELGLGVPDPDPTPAPVPGVTQLTVRAVRHNEVDVLIGDPANPGRLSKPRGVDGVSLFYLVAAAPDQDVARWSFAGNFGRMRGTVPFPIELPAGTKVWLTAMFFNTRKESGPACQPVSATLAGGGMSSLPTAAEAKLAA